MSSKIKTAPAVNSNKKGIAILIATSKGNQGKTVTTSFTTSLNHDGGKVISRISIDMINKVLSGTEPVQLGSSGQFAKLIEDAKKKADIVIVDLGFSSYEKLVIEFGVEDKTLLSLFSSVVIPSPSSSAGEAENCIYDLMEAGVSPEKIKVLPVMIHKLPGRGWRPNLHPFASLFDVCNEMGVTYSKNMYIEDCFAVETSMNLDLTVGEVMAMDLQKAHDEWLALDSERSSKAKDIKARLVKKGMIAVMQTYVEKPQFKETMSWIVS